MTETTGHEAMTIHRLLEFNGVPEDGANADIISNGTKPIRWRRT